MRKTLETPWRVALGVSALLAFAATPAHAGLFAKYHGKDGDFLTDESGNGRNLAEKFNGDGIVSYHPAGFFRFPGNEGADRAWVDWTGGGGAGSFTVSFWARLPAWSQGGFQGLYTNVEPGSFDYQLDIDGGNIRLLSDSGVNASTSAAGLAVDTWHHIVIRKNSSSSCELYVTELGQPLGAPLLTGTSNLGGIQAIRLGANRNRDSFPEMDMANIQVYDDNTVDLNTLLAEGPDLNPTLEWDPADDDAGGAGDWDTTSNSWHNLPGETPNTNWSPNDGTNSAFFAGTAETVTLTEPISVDILRADTLGYLFDSATPADTLTISEAISNRYIATISAPLAGSADVDKRDSGWLYLDGDGSGFSGSLTTSGGRIFVNSPDWGSATFNTVGGLIHFDTGGVVSVDTVTMSTGLRIDNGTVLDVLSGTLSQTGTGGWISTETGDLGTLTSSTGSLSLDYLEDVGGNQRANVLLADFDGSTPLAVSVTGFSDASYQEFHFTQANTYTGGTTLDDIRLYASDPDAFGTGAVDVLEGGQVWLAANTTLANDFTLTGIGWPEGTPFGALRFFNNAEISGDITISDPLGVRIGAPTGITATLSGSLIGSDPLEINAPGVTRDSVIRYTGDGSGYTGEVLVSDGGLELLGSLGGDLFIDDGSEVGGNGSVAGTLTLGTTGGAILNADAAGGLTTGDLVLNGVTTVSFTGFPAGTGPISFLDYTGTLTDDGTPADVTDNFAVANIGDFRSPPVFTDNAMSLEVELDRKSLVFDGTTPDWDINTSFNWNNGVDRYYNGDSVTFDDTVDLAFAGTVAITGTPNPAAITVDNSLVDYVFDGELGGIAGDLTKTGSGVLTLLAPDDNMPYTGSIAVNDGTLELAGDSQALRNSAGIAVNSGATFLVANGNAGQDNLPAILLSGGTLEMNDNVFLFPESSTLTLDTGTDNTLTGTGILYSYTNPVEGAGNLIKDGSGTLDCTFFSGDSLTHTGTTTLNDGLILFGGDNSALSETWNVSGGTLRLQDDSASPIENLPATATVTMTGGTFDLPGNTEALDTLAMDSTSGTPLLSIDPATTALTVDTLDLTGTDNLVRLPGALAGPGPHPVLSYTSALNGTPGTNLVLDPLQYRAGTWNDNAGTLEVTLNPVAITWTGATSTFWEVGGPDANWTGPDNFFYNLDPVTFGDTGAGTVTISDLDGDPVVSGGITFSNTVGNNYVLDGSGTDITGDLIVNGGGVVELQSTHDLSGSVTVTNGSTLVVNAEQSDTINDEAPVTVEAGATLDIASTNAYRRDAPASGGGTDGGTLIDGGTLLHSGGNHSHIDDITLRNGATWTATSPGSFNDENTLLVGNVTVDGTSPSTIGPMTFGMALQGLRVFEVTDVTGDDASDLILSAEAENGGGAGGIDKTGAGTLEFDFVNTYTGQTRVKDGVVTVNGSSQLYSTGGFFGNNDTTYVFIEGGVLETDRFGYGPTRGFSELRNNYYSILIDGGTLRLIGTDVANETPRAFSIGAGGATLEVAAGGFYRKIAGDVPSQNIIYNDNAGDLTLTGEGTGVIEDDLGAYGADWSTTTLTKNGTGTWFLNGANTYGGDTIVNDGLLGGTGLVASNVTVAATGGLAPGASVGTFTITGDLDLSAMAGGAGTLDFELDAIGASDQVVVSGTTGIGSGLLGFSDFAFSNLGGLEDGTYVLITSGTLSGTLDGADLSGSIGPASATLQLNGNDIELVVTGAATEFDLWVGGSFANGTLDPADQDPTDDPDGDGVDNLTEFGLDGDPTDGSNSGKVYLVIADGDDNPDTDDELILTMAVRTGASFGASGSPLTSAAIDGIVYSVEGSLDLATFATPVNLESAAIPPAGAPAPSSGWEYRSFNLEGSDGLPDKGFMRAGVAPAP